MDMFRVTARWTGFTGAPGYSNFYFSSGFLDGGLLGDEAQALAERVRSAFQQLSNTLPDAVSIDIDPEVPVIDSDTGVAQSFNVIDPPETVQGAADGGYSGPSGAVVTWRTNDLRDGRRIRGRTFLVPLYNGSYESDGTLTSRTLDILRGFGNDIRGSGLDGDLGVWSRPVNGSGGVFATVTGHSVPDMAAVLRSRRD